VLDMAAVIQQEAVQLEKAGARYIQVDEPAASTRPEEMELVAQGLAVATKGLKAKTITQCATATSHPSSTRSSVCP
jgi:5-methyltetrahydropteroyltriglutamate--homocysteine methyltransferase